MICHELVFPSHHKCKYPREGGRRGERQEEGKEERRRVGGKRSVKTGKEGRTMSGKGVESVEVKSRNKSGRCPFRERKRGERASAGR